MPTDDESDDRTIDRADDAMNAREADVHARLTAAFGAARHEVPLDNNAASLVETARQHRSNRRVDATGTPVAPTHEDRAAARTERPRQRRSRWITIGVPAAAAIIVIAAIVAVNQERSQQLVASSSASCALVVTFQGHSYRPVHGEEDATFTVTGPLGTGHFPPCNDTGGTPDTSPGQPVTVYRVQGLDPADGIAYHLNGDPSAPKVLLGALDLDRGWGTFTPGFQAFLDAHRTSGGSTAPPDTGAALPPDGSLSQASPPQDTAPGLTGDVPTTMADGAPGESAQNPATTVDPRCPATGTHVVPAQPAPSRPVLTFTPTEVVVCRSTASLAETYQSFTFSDAATIRRLKESLAGLQPPGSQMECTNERGEDLAIVAVSGARRTTIWIELYGCGVVTDGTNLFIGGKSLTWIPELY